MLKRAASAKLMVSSASTTRRAAASSSDEATEHQDDPQDDGQVNGDPRPARGDGSGDAFRISGRYDRMEEIPDHPNHGADNARQRAEPEDPCFRCGLF